MTTQAGQQTGPMRTMFPPARIGHRGLDPDAVYRWYDDTQGELRRLTGDNEQLQVRYATQGAHVLRAAQATAEQLLDDARAEAERTAGDARRGYAEALGGGREKAERIIADALEQAERLVCSAEQDAAGIRQETTEGARASVLFYHALAAAEQQGLEAQLEGLLARVRAWREAAGQVPDRAGVVAPPPMPARR